MKKLSVGLLLATLIASQPVLACTKNGSEGFVPENNLFIPVDAKSINTISEAQFNEVIDTVSDVYAPIVSSYGGKLEVVRKWTDGTVNAYAEQEGNVWKVSMFGGLARHKTITPDGFALVVCHEIGHHIAGAPRYAGDDWASNEGQADYFATTKCLRRVWMNEDNARIVRSMEVPQFLTDSCNKNWKSAADRALCIRGGMAGDSVAKLFAALAWSMKAPKFDTPDPKQVTSTSDSHPATQCRLDTYFQGALCEKSYNEDFTADSEVAGACHGSTGHTVGLRPRCWFKPSVQ
ncbi:hypothetical protein [Peredibacter starrii]|uniref:Metalloprotease n=1 Tax=Peredibacter starrii TaxID=28202 RepID=A0AAX4HKA3_9BACT|nr:hypothetical protein [Peredibacter starrii]WPU63673.1 hypothetical protein SOO65_13340 [Peredibacter starrii]